MRLISLHTPTPAAATTPISPVCPACGIVKRSGKLSCCAPGGSWFGNCGSAGNANLEHTWHEGIRVCNTQFQAVVGQQLHASQPQVNVSFDDTSMDMDSKALIVAAHVFSNPSTTMSFATPITMRAHTPMIMSAYKSTAYAGTTIFKAPNTTIIHTLVKKPISTPIITAVNRTIVEASRSISADVSLASSSYTLVSTSLATRKCEKLPNTVFQISLILSFVCW